MHVDIGSDRLYGASDIEVILAVKVRMDAALKTYFRRAQGDRFFDSPLDLVEAEQVRCAPQIERERTLREGAELALEGAHVRVINVSILYESNRVADDLAPQVVGRFGASQTIGRQNYNVYGLGFSGQACTVDGCTVNGPNPNLKPMTSTNIDLSLAWYFARASLISVSVFDSKIKGYAKTGAIKQDVTVDLVDPVGNITKTYFINTTSQQGAKINGIEVAYEQPIWGGIGVQANISRSDTKVDDGRPMVGASKNSANLGLYFENDTISTRLVYNYRSEYVSTTTAPSPIANSQGLSVINGVTMPAAPTIAGAVSNLAFTFNYDFTKQLQLAFSTTNLLNPVRATYRYSQEEQQKLDSSGRQYYLELRYKF